MTRRARDGEGGGGCGGRRYFVSNSSIKILIFLKTWVSHASLGQWYSICLH